MNQEQSTKRQTTGILLAAGRSSRMGSLKQLLPWPPHSTVIESAFDHVARHCDRMIVVVGHERERVLAALRGRCFEAVESDPDADMLVSIQRGLAAAIEGGPEQIMLIHPADHPEFAAATMARLLEVHAQRPGVGVIPTFRGHGGHPVLVPRELARQIISLNQPGGLRQFWVDHPDLCVRVEVDDPMVVFDLDTPADYSAAGS